MTPSQTKAFKAGMKFRRDNVTMEDLRAEINRQPLAHSVHAASMIQGWEFMDNFILAQDMLEGRA